MGVTGVGVPRRVITTWGGRLVFAHTTIKRPLWVGPMYMGWVCRGLGQTDKGVGEEEESQPWTTEAASSTTGSPAAECRVPQLDQHANRTFRSPPPRPDGLWCGGAVNSDREGGND